MEQDCDNAACPHWPQFVGTFSIEEADRALVADDFGHYIHHLPSAVLMPGSVEDVLRAVQLAHQRGLQIVPRGQGHTTGGQAQIEGGLVLDMRSLNAIGPIQADRVEVEAGALWSTLLQKTLAYGQAHEESADSSSCRDPILSRPLANPSTSNSYAPHGLTPPVLTDYLDLSIGGVLAVGGIGGTSFRHGAITDNVLELQIVTNTGHLERCSPTHQPELFYNTLAGLGQSRIILKAVLRLIPAKTHARVFHLSYPHLAALIQDHLLLLNDNRFDYLVSHILPNAQGTWNYIIEAVNFYTPLIDHPIQLQPSQRGTHESRSVDVEDTTYATFSHRVARQANVLKNLGIWQHPHPWFSAFIPASQVERYVNEALAEISPSDLGPFPIILSGLHHCHFHTPLLHIPNEETFFLFSILRTTAPNIEAINKALAHNQKLLIHAQALGGTAYPIGS